MALLGLATPALADGNAANGGQIFQQCQACHSPDQGVNKFGPSLYRVVGRPAGTIPDYDYSPAMQAAHRKNLVWDEASILAYLEDPHHFLETFDTQPGIANKMPFKLADPQQRQDVVAYLKSMAEK